LREARLHGRVPRAPRGALIGAQLTDELALFDDRRVLAGRCSFDAAVPGRLVAFGRALAGDVRRVIALEALGAEASAVLLGLGRRALHVGARDLAIAIPLLLAAAERATRAFAVAGRLRVIGLLIVVGASHALFEIARLLPHRGLVGAARVVAGPR
jgi:hypothetical protein